ncbi:MAG: 16S rRNA (cytosine(1402)-N(4))-methyltransferase RsmH [Defluviitaleaceae bacterium]|nr:16S rRNA (cytosine(1402)-N(4))-methyltransferase RsmH [Defluviitaleaceae bacterium]
MMISYEEKPKKIEHIPVMLEECLENLNLHRGGTYLDLTLGAGGHSSAILKAGVKKLVSFDRDVDAIKSAQLTFKDTPNITIIHSNFYEVKKVLNKLGISKIDGVLIDLGVSSHQLDTAERGFSYMKEAKLDMRMNREDSKTAFQVVNDYEEAELIKIIKEYGEEKGAKFIARAIILARPVETTLELVNIIKNAVPKKYEMDAVKRTFQAIRIEVNGELQIIESTIKDLIPFLNFGGRICIITFHSLEDRIVKKTFKKLENPCECPRALPCVCGNEKILSAKKMILPTEEEIKRNKRSKSAKLRVGESLGK